MDVHAAAPEAAPSFATLIEPHLDYLYAFARKLCGERMAAEDLVQNTLLRAFRARDSIRNRERPRYWLNGVLNLSPRKGRAMSEIFRVLRPGGRISLADIVIDEELPPEVMTDPDAWAG
jgi:SAM-dependent methyltransferase